MTGLSHKNKFSGNLLLKNKLTGINGMQGIKIEKKLKKSLSSLQSLLIFGFCLTFNFYEKTL